MSILFCFQTLGQSVYWDYLADSCKLSRHLSETGYINIVNKGKTDILEVHPYYTKDRDFNYEVRMNCSQAEQQSRFRRQTGDRRHGLVIDYISPNNYYLLSLKYCNTAEYDDVFNDPHALLEFIHIDGNKRHVLQTAKIKSKIDRYRQHNSFSINYTDGILSIYLGHKELEKKISFKWKPSSDTCRIGYFVSPNNKLTVKRISFYASEKKEFQNQTNYTQAYIDSILQQSKDPIVGYWTYLDRNMNESLLRLGGRYTIAIIEKSAGKYDIVYMTGASARASYWKPLMLKGVLTTTPFTNNFNLQWYDSNKNPLPDEGYVTLDNDILSIHLPVHDTLVRFYKLDNFSPDTIE